MPKHPYGVEDVKDYRKATPEQILTRAKELVGKDLNSLLASSPFIGKIKSPTGEKSFSIKQHGKGVGGQLIERYGFGLESNQREEPDFDDAGIELKIIPLEARTAGLVVKERTKICSIHFHKLLEEKWNTSHAKKKLEKILFIYYLYDQQDVMRSIVKQCDFWQLMESKAESIIRSDWSLVWSMVDDGRAHELSEGLGRILGAARTGQGRDRDWVTQPNNKEKALKRAFALKPSFTTQRWREIVEKKPYESIVANLALKVESFDSFKGAILSKLSALEGLSLLELMQKFRIQEHKGKNAVATILKKILGFKNVNSRIKEFEQLGIDVRVVPVRTTDLRPWEAVSFPTFRLKEFEVEEWEESELMEYVDRILFIPVLFEDKKVPVRQRRLGKAFFWSPTEEEWETIKKEWEMYQEEVRAGKCKIAQMKGKEVTSLTKGSQTKIIHVRPHAKDHNDRDEDSKGNHPVKQSFWLNQKFIQRLLLEN